MNTRRKKEITADTGKQDLAHKVVREPEIRHSVYKFGFIRIMRTCVASAGP